MAPVQSPHCTTGSCAFFCTLLTMRCPPIHAGNCPKPIAGSCASNFTDGTFCGANNLQYEWSAFREISYGYGGC